MDLLNGDLAERELARRSILNFATYVKPKYKVNWHHKVLAEAIDKFVKGEIKRLMIFAPPQTGKNFCNMTPVLTTNGWVKHGDLKVGDCVFGRDGKPVKIEAVSEDFPTEFDVAFTDGSTLQCHGNHEWVVYARNRRKEVVMETKQLFASKVWVGDSDIKKRGNRANFQVDSNVPVEMPEVELPIHPYVLGVWLGNGTAKGDCITHDKKDTSTVEKIESLGFIKTGLTVHAGTGVHTTRFQSLGWALKEHNLYDNKHIPAIYLRSSMEQRLELLAGLIDTDGTIYHKNGRVTFANCNKRIIDGVHKLVISLGCRVTITEYEPCLSTSGIQGKQVCYQLCFQPNFHIPLTVERKKTRNINPTIRKRGIVSVKKSKKQSKGKCIQVEGGIYLVGKTLIPTHNSELTSRMLPPFILGKNPDAKIILASYSAAIAEGMSNNCQKYIDSDEYKRLFPNTTLQKAGVNGSWKRNAQEFQIVNHEGYLWAVGAGGSATSKTADYVIIDDPHKDRQEAQSALTSNRVWEWYTDVMDTRIHNDSGIMIMQTRWDFMDLSGRLLQSMEDKLGDEWTVICFKAIKENELVPYDPRKTGEALWPDRHSLERMLKKQKESKRTFESLYQQNPQPVMSGGECYKDFDRNEIVKPCKYNPELTTHITFDFNKQPYMTAVIWQTEAVTIGERKKWITRCVKELCLASPKNTTRHVCIAARNFFTDLKAKLFIYGDPHGMDEDTRSEQGHNDYKIIQKELRLFNPSLRIMKKAPNVGKRIEFMNALFAGSIEDIELQIDPSCTKVIDDYQYIKEDEEGGKFKQMWTDPGTGVRSQRYGHASDSNEYFLTYAFIRQFAKFLQGDTEPKILIGKRKDPLNRDMRGSGMY